MAEKSRNVPATPKNAKYSGFNNRKRFTARKPKQKGRNANPTPTPGKEVG